MGEVQRYQVTYHRLVDSDIAKIDSNFRVHIRSAIEYKLFTLPQLYGKPLRNTLAGCWTLRVGDYRVVFEIKKKTVHVISIRHRSEGYKGIEKRNI